MRLKGIILLAAVAAAWPAAATAGTRHGVVVGRQHGLLLVAGSNGAVTAVRPRAALGLRHTGRAFIHGVVVRHTGSTTFLSSNRHLVAFHDTGTPVAGSVVNATVAVQPNGELDDVGEDQVGQVAGTIPVQATVAAVGAGTVTLTVNGQSVVLSLPAGLTLPASVVGQTVTLNVALGGGGGNDGGNGGGDD